VKVEYGLDVNSNNVLDATEINATLTKYICNGPTGLIGATGAQGIQGVAGTVGATGATGAAGKNTLAKTTAEVAGANCATGGVKVEYGLDVNSNNVLDATEINATLTKYICNGTAGATGATGPTGLTGATGAQGIQGVAGTAGAAGATGAAGKNTLAKTTTEVAGANCATGGVKVEYGLDLNSNSVLDISEINATLTKYICNGIAGATGAQGIQGTPGSENAWSLTGNTSTTPITNFIGTVDAQDLVVRTNNSERLRLTSAGNLGIGLINPLATLTVRNSVNTPNTIVSDLGNSIFEGGFRLVSLKGVSTNNSGDAVLKFGMVYGNSSFTNSSLIRFHRGTAANDGSISFSTNDDAVEIMRLANVANVGRVGIGTSTPAATLDLNGSLKITNGSQGAGKVLTSDASGNATWQSPSGSGISRIVAGTTSAGFAPSILNGSGFTVTRVNAGNYSVTFTTPYTVTPTVNATVFLSNGTYLSEMQIVKVSGITTNGFTVHTLNYTGGTLMNAIDHLPFSFIAAGN
jgi:hypothetical protein